MPTVTIHLDNTRCGWCGDVHPGRGEFCCSQCRSSWHRHFRQIAESVGFREPGKAKEMLTGRMQIGLAMMQVLVRSLYA